jgi:hypothetical protein
METASCLIRLVNLCFYTTGFRMKAEKISIPERVLTIQICIFNEMTICNLKGNELACFILLQSVLIKDNITFKVPVFEVIFPYQMKCRQQ